MLMPVIFAFDDFAMFDANFKPFSDDFDPSIGTSMFLILSTRLQNNYDK